MNVLEQLQALGFQEEPALLYEDGGDVGADGSMGFGIEGGGYGGAGYGNVGYGGAGDVSPDALASIASAGTTWGSEGGKQAIAALEALDALGYGRMEGINAANPTQSVQELIASSNLATAAPYALAFMPGAGLARGLQTGAQFLADLSSGKLSPQDALADLGLTLASAITGQSKGTLAAAAKGDLGEAASLAAKGAITSALAQHIGAPASVVGAGVNAVFSGIGSGTGYTGGLGGGGTDVAGGPSGMTSGGTDTASLGGDASPSFDIGNLGPLFTVAALEDLLTPQEKQEREQTRITTVSPFGSMPYA